MLIELSSAVQKFSMETLVGEIIFLGTEKSEADYRGKSILSIIFFEFSGHPDNQKGSKIYIFQSNHLQQKLGFGLGFR